MKKSLGNVIKFKKAKPPLNKKIIGNYCLLEPLNNVFSLLLFLVGVWMLTIKDIDFNLHF